MHGSFGISRKPSRNLQFVPNSIPSTSPGITAFCVCKIMTDETKTPTRDEIPEADKWDLSRLFTSADNGAKTSPGSR